MAEAGSVIKPQRKLVALPKKELPPIKTVYVTFGNRIYIGNPVYEDVPVDTEEGAPVGSEVVMVELTDVYEVLVYPMPHPVAANKSIAVPGQLDVEMGISMNLLMLKIGKGIEIPQDVFICELDNTSPFYAQYIEATTGQKIVMPVGPKEGGE
jgi:hypothetical protein